MIVVGPATLATVAQLFEEGQAQIEAGVATVDLGEVSEVDSSALALLLAWRRAARARGRELAFAGLPEGLLAIARLYGVAEFLPRAQPAAGRAH
ncbi:MAG: STAS domain-containing protein [Burkholderiales bacterium]|nr:STAS domain-containing protein [Burkholderiales bacterium]